MFPADMVLKVVPPFGTMTAEGTKPERFCVLFVHMAPEAIQTIRAAVCLSAVITYTALSAWRWNFALT